MKSYNDYNDYNSYTSYFKSPFHFSSGGANKSVSQLWLKRLEENRRSEALRMQANNRSNWDRAFDFLSSANYASAGLASGLVDMAQGDKGASLGKAFSQAGKGFMHGINIFSNDTSDKDEYTYSKVLGNMGWKPTTLTGKVAKGILGFTGDVLLDPTTYLTLGGSALIKGTGKAGKAIEGLAKMADDLPYIRFDNKVDELLKKGHTPKVAEHIATKEFDAEIARGQEKLNHMTSDMATEIVKKHYRETGKFANEADVLKGAERFKQEYNRLSGFRHDEKVPGITFGIRNAPFGDRLAEKMGKFGKTVTILDNTQFMRELGDKMGIAHGYAKLRDAVYGSKIGKMFSNNHPIYKLAQKNPAELFKFIESDQYTRGLKGGKLEREKILRDQAKAMNLDLSPAEMKEVMTVMENKSVQGKLAKIVKFSQTQKAKEIHTILASASTKLKDEVATLIDKKDTLNQMKQAADDNVIGAKEAYSRAEKEYHQELTSLDLEKVTNMDELKKLKEAYQVESQKLEARIAKQAERKQVTVEHFTRLHEKAMQEIADHKAGIEEAKKTKEQKLAEAEKNKGEKKKKPATVRKPKEQGKSDRTVADDIIDAYEEKVKEIYAREDLKPKAKAVEMKKLKVQRDLDLHGAYNDYRETKGNATKESVQEFINKTEDDFKDTTTPNKAQASHELVDELSKYIYGKTGVLVYGTHIKNIEELVQKIQKGASPEDLERFIDSKPHLFSEHHLEVNSYLASKYRYKTWEEAYHKPMEPIAEKLRAGQALTPDEERLKLSLLSLKAAREGDRMKYIHKMSFEDFMRHRNDVANDFELDDMLNELDLTQKRSSALNSQSAIGKSDYEQKMGKDYRDAIEKGTADKEFNKVSEDDRNAMFDDATAIYGSKVYKRDGKLTDKSYTALTRITHAMMDILINDFQGARYTELSPSKRHQLFKNAVYKVNGINPKKPSKANDFVRALLQESNRRNAQGRLTHMLDNTKVGMDVTFMQDGVRLVGNVVKTEPSTGGTIFHVKRSNGKVYQINVRDIQHNHGYPKGFLDSTQKTYISKVSSEALAQKADLQDNIAKLDERIKQVDETFAKRRQQADRFYQQRLNQAEKTIVDYETEATKYHDTLLSFDDNLIEDMQKQLKELENAQRSDDALEIWARMHNQHDLENLADPNRWNHVERNSPAPNGKKGVKGYTQNGKIHVTDTPVDGAHINNRYKYFKDQFKKEGFDASKIKEIFKDNPERFDQYLLEHEQSHIRNNDPAKSYKRQWGDVENDKIELRADIDAFNMVKAFDPDEIVKSETFLTKSAKDSLESNVSSDKIGKYVDMLTKEFERMGLEEVRIGKLNKDQFESMLGNYLPHIPTEEGKRFIESSQEFKDYREHRSVTQDLGYGVKWNPYAKSRSIQGKNIFEINQHFDAAMKGKNLFQENIADIWLTRALKHEELMYDDSYMNHMMDNFGTTMKPGDEIEKGYKAVVNYGHLKENIRKQVVQMVNDAKARGIKPDATLFDNYTNQVINKMGLPKGILDEFATPMIELTQDQVDKISPHGIVKSVNDAIVDKANQARKLQIAKDKNRFLQMYDKFLHLIKLNQTTVIPAFHIRNKLSNMYLNWLAVGSDAVNPRLQYDSLKAVHYKGDMEKLKDMRPLTIKDMDGNVTGVLHWNEIYEQALMHGVIDEGFFAKEFGAEAKTRGKLKGKARVEIKGKQLDLDPTDTDNFVLYKYGREIGGRIENGDRLLQFASRLRKGATAEEAARGVDKFLFDYGDLTMFEQNVMKRIFPYYTWMRKNGRLQASQILEQPGKYRDTAKALHAVSDMNNEEDKVDRRMMAPFAQDWIQTPFGGKDKPIMLNPNLPFQDLNNLPNMTDLVGTAKTIASKASPIIKAPAELIANKNLFLDAPISEEDSKNPVGDKLKYLANQGAIPQAVNGFNEKASGTGKALQALSTLGGIKATQYDVKSMKDHLIEDKKVKYGDDANEPMEKVLGVLNSTFKSVAHTGLKAISPAKPKSAFQYEGALRPISSETYNNLSDKEKKKYTAPTKKDATAYNKKAQQLEKEAYKKTGKVKKFLWTLLDATDMQKDNKPQVGRVMKVIDGDTFVVKIGNEEKSVRMLLIDTPETVEKGTPVMPEGKNASNYTKKHLKDKDVKLVYEGSDTDYYGRKVAYISVDGKDYNKELVDKGLAKVRFTKPIDTNFPTLSKLAPNYSKTKEYFKAEKKASKKKKGIHQDKYKGYVRPGKDEDYSLGAVERYLKKKE